MFGKGKDKGFLKGGGGSGGGILFNKKFSQLNCIGGSRLVAE